MRIIFVPQYPVPNRYQSWWWWRFPDELRHAGFNVVVLGEHYPSKMKRGHISMFSPIEEAIKLELEQIDQFMKLQIEEDDILFLADISFPGIFSNILYHKSPPKMVAFCHATSLNKYDYFEEVRVSKYQTEKAHAIMFDKIFVGSEYHAKKLQWPNLVVSSLPMPTHIPRFRNEEKIYDIVSASRPGKQKVDPDLETAVENKFGKIIRKETAFPEDYYKFLGQSKILIITSHEDTFGYQIVDAINNNCIPIARNSLSYPELLPPEYLYNNEDELIMLINRALWGQLQVPRLICEEQMNNFFRTIIKEIINI